MSKIIFGIFAHPDDEAFGPSGTLLKEVKAGTELHLITLTNGDAGMNPDNLPNLGETRLQEWKTAGELLGAKGMKHLGFKDGHLSNIAMIEIGNQLVDFVTSVLQGSSKDAEIEFITLDLNGLTGHIDHIVAARAACFAFYSLKKADSRFSRIRFSCITAADYPSVDTSWIFREKGRTSEEINETIDARDLAGELVAIANCHQTQRHDLEHFLATAGDNLGLNYFIVRT